MKEVLVFGSGGFIGRNVVNLLHTTGIDVTTASFNAKDEPDDIVDLSDRESILTALLKHKPKRIINCAGVVENSPKAEMNYVFTKNILDAVILSEIGLERIIIIGSAGEYGVVDDVAKSVSEETELKADSLYGLSKVKESSYALQKSNEAGLSLAVARLFNPVGLGMHPRMLIPRVIEQLNTGISGGRRVVEINRLDAVRDYIGIVDVASALNKILLKNNLRHDTYNVGSGESTSNKTLLDLIVKAFDLTGKVDYVESSMVKEPTYAARANINRLHKEFGWLPKNTLEEVIKEMAEDARS